jgi:hypothetical protein
MGNDRNMNILFVTENNRNMDIYSGTQEMTGTRNVIINTVTNGTCYNNQEHGGMTGTRIYNQEHGE